MTTDNSEWVMVPRKPTADMRGAGSSASEQTDDEVRPSAAATIYRAMLEAAPTPPSAPGVRVRALEWSKGIVDTASPLPGLRYVACSTTPHGSWAWWLDHAPETRGVFTSEAAAKAAAQADYEARILSTLEPSPQPIADGGWLPIEGAPKDGTEILAGRFVLGKKPIVKVDSYKQPKDCVGYVGFSHFNMQWWPPTHWMPLPAPPAALNEGTGE